MNSLEGILLVDKPCAVTSAEVVRQVKKRCARGVRAGHLGTLDPFATGLLPVLLGQATKLAPFLNEKEKEYEGVIQLGAETDTLDRDGRIIRTAPVPPLDNQRLAAIAARFTGKIQQTPPVFSALKRGGVPLYKLARSGVEIAPLAARPVEIRRLGLELASTSTIRLSVICSTGTYVRALARDIGAALDSAAYLAELRRIRAGNFSVDDSAPLGEIVEALEHGGPIRIVGMREALTDLVEVEVDASHAVWLRNGDWRALEGLAPPGEATFKIIAAGRLIAIARAASDAPASLLRVFPA
ncbi:MAG: tRNA pseudouridine(55) synthase TruB [Candidatus Binataceae bacterium]